MLGPIFIASLHLRVFALNSDWIIAAEEERGGNRNLRRRPPPNRSGSGGTEWWSVAQWGRIDYEDDDDDDDEPEKEGEDDFMLMGPFCSRRAGMPCQRVLAGSVSPFISSDRSPIEAPG